MAAVCAKGTAGVDVKLPLQIAALDSSIGQKADRWRRLCPRSDFRPPRPNREAIVVPAQRRLSELRQRGVDLLQQLLRALIFSRGARFFEIAYRLVPPLLHRGQCTEVEIDERACDAAVAQVSARGRLPKQRRSAAGAEQLDPNQGPEILADQTLRRFFLAGQHLDVEAVKLDPQISRDPCVSGFGVSVDFPLDYANALGKLAG